MMDDELSQLSQSPPPFCIEDWRTFVVACKAAHISFETITEYTIEQHDGFDLEVAMLVVFNVYEVTMETDDWDNWSLSPSAEIDSEI